ncbi:hypothetical protein CR513_32966, partial [Mucuna pruriens]
MTIQLANRSVVQPLGILEDVNDLIFPADFYVLDMEDEMSRKGSALIMGRSFLMTAKTKIDVYAGTLSMEFGDNLHPTEDHSLFGIDMIDELVEEHTQLDPDSDEMPSFVEIINVLYCAASVAGAADSIEMSEPRSTTETFPAHVPPEELKSLSSHLKYAYLDDHQQLPVIIANNLHRGQEEKLLQVLRHHKKAIGQQQRRLNPTILDVVKKEVRKLLVVGIIYPISDSNWVSPVQVVPKKSGMTVMKNWHDKMKLNQATRKDHFPLPFIDQVLEKLVEKSHYCFLDGYFGYMQIHITLEDQHKTTFTCPFDTFTYT